MDQISFLRPGFPGRFWGVRDPQIWAINICRFLGICMIQVQVKCEITEIHPPTKWGLCDHGPSLQTNPMSLECPRHSATSQACTWRMGDMGGKKVPREGGFEGATGAAASSEGRGVREVTPHQPRAWVARGTSPVGLMGPAQPCSQREPRDLPWNCRRWTDLEPKGQRAQR